VSPPAEDPGGAVFAAAQRHFEAGQKELDLRHLERAKAEFDLALAVLLESPAGARSDPRTREAFDRMVDQISAYELTALAEDDGFTERTSELPWQPTWPARRTTFPSL
jgi:membrane-bound lytic murein transglycosylase D